MVVLLHGQSSVCVPVHAVVVCLDDIVIVAIPYPRMEELTVKEVKSRLSHVSNNHVRFTECTVNGVCLARAQPLAVSERSHAYERALPLRQLMEDASAIIWVMLRRRFIVISDPVLLMGNTPTGGNSLDVQRHVELDNRHAYVSAQTRVLSMEVRDAWDHS